MTDTERVPPSSNPQQSPAEAEYKHLTSYFHSLVKYTALALAVVIGIGGLFFHGRMADISREASEEAKKIATEQSKKSVEDAFQQQNIESLIKKAAAEKVSQVTDVEIERRLN